jgi:hypothetical protein
MMPAVESNRVIGLRTMKLMRGGKRPKRDAERQCCESENRSS